MYVHIVCIYGYLLNAVYSTFALTLCRKSRSTFDNTEIKKVFGPVIVHYGYVQKKVNDKYDTWHKEVLTKFGGMLGQNMQDFYGSVSKVCLQCVLVIPWSMCDDGVFV